MCWYIEFYCGNIITSYILFIIANYRIHVLIQDK